MIKFIKRFSSKQFVRNFCIIAHVDHGKSTLCDRIIEKCLDSSIENTQVLDKLEVEKERGITVKSQTVSLNYSLNNHSYLLNIIDTPGHSDFSYEVKRMLPICEGAVLLIDSTQGIQAQTVAHYNSAVNNNLKLIFAFNKCDLSSSDIQESKIQLENLINKQIQDKDIIKISAKTGQGVDYLLKNVIEHLPAPRDLDLNYAGLFDNKNYIENKFLRKKLTRKSFPNIFRGLIFDSWFIDNKGVYFFIRLYNGNINKGDNFIIGSNQNVFTVNSIGKFIPNEKEFNNIQEGEVAYIFCNIKNSKDAVKNLGKSITSPHDKISQLESIQKPKSIVYSSIYPENSEELEKFISAFDKILLEDPSIDISVDNSLALGQGYKCGFLGSLHMEVFVDRLKNDFKIDVITTPPNIEFKAYYDKQYITISNPIEGIEKSIKIWQEQICNIYIMVDYSFDSDIRNLIENSRGNLLEVINFNTQNKYICKIPLIEIIDNFNEKIKSLTHGFASWDYQLAEFKKSKIDVVTIWINNELVEAFSFITHTDKAFNKAKSLIKTIKNNIPSQLFSFSIQGRIGNKTIASETIKSIGKNVLSKCYGGDFSRKKKLIDKQKQGKQKMKEFGKVQVPSKAISKIFKDIQIN